VPKIAARIWNKRLDWPEKGGSRAEVRRERKKRDIPQPCESALINNISKSSMQKLPI
jgi:hypothetical protein